MKRVKQNTSRVWNTKMVDESVRLINDGVELSDTPFFENDIELRGSDIVYDYTPAEQEIWLRCANDPLYFAQYCKLLTDDGYSSVTLREYQEDFIKTIHGNKFTIILAARQVGKTTISGIYLTWYLIFNKDRNVMILANKGATTTEIIDKVKNIIKGLPFFLKPGVIRNAAGSMRFDNGCRLLSQATSKSAAIGFTLHLVYLDEFAHINPTFLEPFYRSVYPTISSSKVAKMVITSTPNGMNKFYDLWVGALEGRNDFQPLRVDYWLIPGRETEEWKTREIANLGGSEELFNQEYGLQFLKSSSLLLDPKNLMKIKSVKTPYEHKEITLFDDLEIKYNDLKWHPKFNPLETKETDRFLFTVDISEGKMKDFTVINIMKLVPLSVKHIDAMKSFEDEKDFFGLLQIGLWRSNNADIDEVSKMIKGLIFDLLNEEQVKMIIEMNFKGDLLLTKLNDDDRFFEELLIHTKHTEKARNLQPGVRLNKQNKPMYCFNLKKLIEQYRIIPTEEVTYLELCAFGLNNKGSYSSQIGHDDIAMTLVNSSIYFDSIDFDEQVEDYIDSIDKKYDDAIKRKMKELDDSDRNNAKGYAGDFDYLKGLM